METLHESIWAEISFKKIAGWGIATLLKKDSNKGVFPWSFEKYFFPWSFEKNLFYRTPPVTASLSPMAASVLFIKKIIKQLFCNFVRRTNNVFFSTHRLMYKKSNSFLYKFVVNCQIFEITLSGCALWSWKLVCSITWTILFETPSLRYLSICL